MQHHAMETLSALPALCEGNGPVMDGSPLEMVSDMFGVLFVAR